MPRGVDLGPRSRVDPAGRENPEERRPISEVPQRPSPHNFPGRILRHKKRGGRRHRRM
jgi:hypothetical protein